MNESILFILPLIGGVLAWIGLWEIVKRLVEMRGFEEENGKP